MYFRPRRSHRLADGRGHELTADKQLNRSGLDLLCSVTQRNIDGGIARHIHGARRGADEGDDGSGQIRSDGKQLNGHGRVGTRRAHLMNFNRQHVVAGNQAADREIHRTFIDRVTDASRGGCGSGDGPVRHADTINFRAVQIENGAVIYDVAKPQSGAAGIAGKIKVRSEIIRCDAAADGQCRADRFGQTRHRASLTLEQSQTGSPGTVVELHFLPGGA